MNLREKAWNLLCDICIDHQYSNLLLRHELQHYEALDRALITHIIYGTLQQHQMVRFQWKTLVKKQPPEELSILLDMSVYQLFFMDKLPDYAIVNEAVNIAKKMNVKFANMVNAILHNVIRQGLKQPSGTEEEILSIVTSHPLWLIHMWNAQYGKEVCKRICEDNMKTHASAARVNTLKITKAEILKQDENFEEGVIAKDALRFHGSSIANTSLYQEGLIAIQDEASQLVAEILDAKPEEHILDVCSAPGTKTTHIAQTMQNKGSIIAGDIHEHRIKLVQEGAKRLGIEIIEARVMDALELNGLIESSFDRVLCDVPCSGYGVLGRKSDIKYHMQSNDMDTLIPLQYRILCKACTMVKSNGILMYSTCTLNKKENEKQIEKFLKEHEEFELIEERTIFPYEYDCDGFYIAKLQKL